MIARHASPLLALAVLAVACGDDAPGPSSSEGGGGAGSTTSSTSTTGDGGAPGTGGGDGGAASGGGGGGVATSCGDGVAIEDLEGGAWDTRFTISGFTGHDGFAPAVHDFAIDTDGSVVATGRFQWLEGQAIPPLMRWRDGGWEPARDTWELPAPLDGFSAIAIAPDGALALATNDSFGERDGSIWIDDGTGLRSIGDFGGQVRSLAWFDGQLWAAGLFAIGDADPVVGLAVWNGTTWAAPPGGPLIAGELGGAAFELLVDGEALLVAGAFAGVGGIPAANVASFEAGVWTALDLDDAMVVYALARTASGQLHAGGALGAFDEPGGVARWDGAAWEIVGGGLGQYQTRGVVTDLAVHGDVVDATGCFSTAGGLMDAAGSVPSPGVARWDGSTWVSLDDASGGVLTPWFQPFVCGDEGLTAIWDVPHQRLAHDGESLFAGGYFSGVDGVVSQSIAAHDGTSWRAQGESGLGVGGSIDLIAAGGDACEVVGLGQMSHVAGEPVDGRAVRWAGDRWVSLPDPLPRDAYCPALDVSDTGEVAVGCMVFPAQGDAEGVVLRRDGDALVPMDLEAPGPITALRWSPDGSLWVGGTGATSWIGRVDDGALTVLVDDLDAPANHIDVAASDDVIVAGAFTVIDGVEASRIARWDGAAWSALGEGLPGQVTALGRDGSSVYASSYDEGAGALLLGGFELGADADGWRELAGPEAGVTPQSYFSFNVIRPIDGGLLLGGTAEMDDGSGRGVLIYADGALRPLVGGVGAMGIGGLAVTGDGVWIAGTIGEAGSGDDRVSSVGIARLVIEPSAVAP